MFEHFQTLKKHRNFRLLFIGQGISFVGTQITMVAIPYQMYDLNHSPFLVGILGLCTFFPLVITALLGGIIADRFNRKNILIVAEFFLMLCLFVLFLNTEIPHFASAVLFLMAAIISMFNGLHRPSIQSMLQVLVPENERIRIGSLWSTMINFGLVTGPALSGLLIKFIGLKWTFLIDALSYLLSFIMINQISFKDEGIRLRDKTLDSLKEGFQFAFTKQELVGSYLVDIVAMFFGMPSALFPALAVQFGGAHILGFLYSSIAVGSFIASIFSAWTHKIKRFGVGITLSAIIWGVFIIILGFSHHVLVACFCLCVAGAADSYSGIFRQSLWNLTVPNELRGRLAGIEMLSYMSGPTLGNFEAGIVASLFSIETSIISGGIICVFAVALVAGYLPKFWHFKNQVDSKD